MCFCRICTNIAPDFKYRKKKHNLKKVALVKGDLIDKYIRLRDISCSENK